MASDDAEKVRTIDLDVGTWWGNKISAKYYIQCARMETELPGRKKTHAAGF